MKTKTKKYTQKLFADLFKSLDQPGVSRLLSGKDNVSFPLAVELAELFPFKDIIGWKKASKEDLTRIYNFCRRKYEDR